MTSPIEFYFDFSSPYGYFASHRIDDIAKRHGCAVNWRPYLMGVVFKITGRHPVVQHPLLKEYSIHDMDRTARLQGVPFNYPSQFPVGSVAACRAYYWLADRDAGQARAFARALYHAYFVDDRNIGEAEQVLAVAGEHGIDRREVSAALDDPAVKDRLRAANDEAVGRQVFGSPFVIVDGEAFWGNDRLDQVDRWLATGGW